MALGGLMSADDTIDFWFMVGSTYTYLTVSRLHEVEAASQIRFRWRPFNARAIMQEMDNIPFATKPTKLAYMWRDVERRASKYGLLSKVPAPYPLKNLELANRVAVLGVSEGWCSDYVRATYRLWFAEEKSPEANLISRRACGRLNKIRLGSSWQQKMILSAARWKPAPEKQKS